MQLALLTEIDRNFSHAKFPLGQQRVKRKKKKERRNHLYVVDVRVVVPTELTILLFILTRFDGRIYIATNQQNRWEASAIRRLSFLSLESNEFHDQRFESRPQHKVINQNRSYTIVTSR